MTWNSFRDVAGKVVKQKGLNKQIEDSLVLQSANQLLDNFLSTQAQEKVRAVYFRAGVLSIAVLDDNLLKKLLSDKDLFVASLNSKLGDAIVDNLNFLS